MFDAKVAPTLRTGKPRRTPVVSLRDSIGSWHNVWLKDETQQVTGAFKFRGNFQCLSDLSSNAAVVTASTGNHGLGLATAAAITGRRATIFAPQSTPDRKRLAIEATGARLVQLNAGYDDCETKARQHAQEHDEQFIHSFDDPRVIAGHASLCVEIDELGYTPDVVFVPVGGGGLLSACLHHWKTKPLVIGVEVDTAPALSLSLRAKRRITLPAATGWMEGLLVRRVGCTVFELASLRQTPVVLVSPMQIARALQVLWYRNQIRAEGAGAAALAAAMNTRIPGASSCLCVVSGGNIDDAVFMAQLSVGESE
jgi:threonine dehydratase